MKREHPDERRNISRSSVAVTGGMMSGKNKMTEKSATSFDAGFEQELAQVGYQIRSSDMADVALKLEQLEMAMVNTAEDGVLHLSTDTIHYNPADVSNWLDSMLSEFNAPYIPNLDPNRSSLLDDAISSTKSSSNFVNSTQMNTQPSRIYDPCPNYDLSAIPGEIVCAKTEKSESSSGRESKRLKSSPPHPEESSPETIRPVVLVDSQETGIRLVHTLMACAEAVQQGNLTIAEALVKQIGLLAAAQPGAMKKVASYFAEALARRIYNLYHEPLNPSISDILQMHFYETCPYLKFAHFTANQAILEAFAGKSRVHVIDFSINQGMQWPALMQALALRPGGPPAFRLIGVGPRQPDNSDALQRVGWKLAQLAETINIEFEFRGLVTNNLEELDPSLLDIRANDSVAVNSMFVLHRLLAQPGAIDKVFSCIKSIRPKILTIVEQEANHNGPVFLDRFTESLHYYSSMFDSLEGCGMSPPTSEDLVMSEEYLGRQICNVVACEGPERVERHETLAQWRTRLGSAGFAPVHLGSNAFKQASMLLALFAGGDGYKVEENNGCLMLNWHTRPLIATSAWHIVEH